MLLTIGAVLSVVLVAACGGVLLSRRRKIESQHPSRRDYGADRPGRPDLGLRLEDRGLLGLNSGFMRRVNTLLDELGSSFRHLFSSGFEQTRLADSVKSDAAAMVETADRTERLAAQVAAAMSEMSATVGEIVLTVHQTAASTGHLPGRARKAGGALDKVESSVESVRRLSLQITSWAETNKALSQASG